MVYYKITRKDKMMFEYNELNEMLKNASLNFNTRPVEKFENYSPSEMSNILNHSFENDSIITFRNDLPSSLFKKVPFFNCVKYLLNIIKRENEIKLTPSGNLPNKFVKELYDKKFILDDFTPETKNIKSFKETEIRSIHLSKVICYVAKLVKTQKNSILLTKLGQEIIKDDFELLKILFVNFYKDYNLSYMDSYPEFDFSQVSPFFLLLIGKYGESKKNIDFYYDKMIKAFPALHVPSDLDEYVDIESNIDFSEYCKKAFTFRLIENFLLLFNFVEYDIKSNSLKKTKLFDTLFLILPNTATLKNHSEKIM